MIVERRVIDVPAGPSTIRFMGVSDQIVPQTSVLQSFEGFTLESNFDGDLITRGALLDKAIGETLTVRRMNPKTGEKSLLKGRLVSAANRNEVIQGIVLETQDGIETLECSGLSEALIFNSLPKGLSAKPVLSMEVNAETAGEREVFLSYLSRGIGWQADYRLDVGQDQKGEGALTGWLTVTNNTAKSFKDAPTAIVAGDLNMTGNTKPDVKVQKTFTPGCWTVGSTKRGTRVNAALYKYIQPAGGGGKVYGWDGGVYDSMADVPPQPLAYTIEPSPEPVSFRGRMAQQEELGDYKLYRTPKPVTVAAMQTKQIAFIGIDDAEYDRIYKFKIDDAIRYYGADPLPLRVEYEVDNSKDGNLGKPLPKGTVRVMTRRDNGRTALLGEDSIRNLAIDLPVEIYVSDSVGVMGKMFTDITGSDGVFDLKIRADIMNATSTPIRTEVEINIETIRYADLSDESHERREGEIIPTYWVDVDPESKEEFLVSLKVIKRPTFRHNTRNYDKKEAYEREVNTAETWLAGENGRRINIDHFLNGNVLTHGTLKAQLNQREDVEKDNVTLTRLDETFTFTNAFDRPTTLRFSYQKDAKYETVVVQEAFMDNGRMIPAVTKAVSKHAVELISSNIDPVDANRLEWELEVPANGKVELNVVTEGAHKF